MTTDLTKLNTILSIQKRKQLRTQGREQLAGKKGSWILIPGLPSGINPGQLIYSLPWRLFLESQGLNKNRSGPSESETTCLDSQSQCNPQAPLCSQRLCLLLKAISHVFLCHLLALMSDSQELPCLGWFMPGTHDCQPQVVRKHSEQTEEQSSDPPPTFLQRAFWWLGCQAGSLPLLWHLTVRVGPYAYGDRCAYLQAESEPGLLSHVESCVCSARSDQSPWEGDLELSCCFDHEP